MRHPVLLGVVAAMLAAAGCGGGDDAPVAGRTTIPHPPPLTGPAPASAEPALTHAELADRLDGACARATELLADAAAQAQASAPRTPAQQARANRELRARVARRLRPALGAHPGAADRPALVRLARAVRDLDTIDARLDRAHADGDRAAVARLAAQRRRALRDRAAAAAELDAPSCADG